MEAGPAYGIVRPPQAHGQASSVKRSHSQMEHGRRRLSPSPLFVQAESLSPDRESPPPPPSQNHNHSNTALPLFRARFPGDGLDLRRPVSTMSTNNARIIDLTDADDSNDSSAYATPQPEQRLAQHPPRRQRMPRYSRQIIDLSSEPDEEPPRPTRQQDIREQARQNRHQDRRERQQNMREMEQDRRDREQDRRDVQQDTSNQPNPQPSSPEVQFLRERPRAARNRLEDRQPTPHPQDLAIHDLTVDLDEEVIHVRTEGPTGINNTGPQGRYGVREPFSRGFGRLADFVTRRLTEEHADARGARGALDWGLGHVLRGVGGDENIWMDMDDFEGDVDVGRPRAARPGVGAVPMGMDYETVAMGFVDPDATRRPPTPKYSPPPDVAPGFTRSPREEDVVVCPNCGDELGIGQTDDKKQVWIIKACGHVYCGDCMINRKSKRKGKAKVTDAISISLPPPFSACQVRDCGKPVNKNHVMQIFL